MANKKIKTEEFSAAVVSPFGDSFGDEISERFELLHEFECTQRIDSPIKPDKFQVFTDSISLKKILRMSWKNVSGVALKNIRLNIPSVILTLLIQTNCFSVQCPLSCQPQRHCFDFNSFFLCWI